MPSSNSRSALDPISRASELLFGLIMVLSFTCSLSILDALKSDVRDMLIAAVGCNLAWGIIDAFFYLLSVATERAYESKGTSDKQSLIKLHDLRAAFAVFALVFLSTFPVALPFLLMNNMQMALRVSNLIALLLLFSIGYSLGRDVGRSAILWGTIVTFFGVGLVALTIELGG